VAWLRILQETISPVLKETQRKAEKIANSTPNIWQMEKSDSFSSFFMDAVPAYPSPSIHKERGGRETPK